MMNLKLAGIRIATDSCDCLVGKETIYERNIFSLDDALREVRNVDFVIEAMFQVDNEIEFIFIEIDEDKARRLLQIETVL